jgi:TMEM154 protein family
MRTATTRKLMVTSHRSSRRRNELVTISDNDDLYHMRQCIIQMTSSDFNNDNVLDHIEYINFVNHMIPIIVSESIWLNVNADENKFVTLNQSNICYDMIQQQPIVSKNVNQEDTTRASRVRTANVINIFNSTTTTNSSTNLSSATTTTTTTTTKEDDDDDNIITSLQELFYERLFLDLSCYCHNNNENNNTMLRLDCCSVENISNHVLFLPTYNILIQQDDNNITSQPMNSTNSSVLVTDDYSANLCHHVIETIQQACILFPSSNESISTTNDTTINQNSTTSLSQDIDKIDTNNDHEDSNTTNNWLMIIIILLGLVVLLSIGILGIILYRYRKRPQQPVSELIYDGSGHEHGSTNMNPKIRDSTVNSSTYRKEPQNLSSSLSNSISRLSTTGINNIF